MSVSKTARLPRLLSITSNANVDNKGRIGNGVATEFSKTAFADTIKRLQPMLSGVELDATDVIGMLQLCS